MMLEHGMTILSKMNPNSTLAQEGANGVVKLLYNDLPHPASSYVGKQYQYRSADGSNNNVDVPDMGKANTPYSRSVQSAHPLPPATMPDAGLLFDTLLRRDEFKPHPGGLSSLMFAFAALVIHTVFQTSHTDVAINETSSYVDLAPLYGDIQEDQDKIRVRDGRGLLYPDTFAEDRLMLLPPACCVILVCFNRNHNFIAKRILEINERGWYVDPDSIPSDDPKKHEKLLEQEEDIFQTARLVNIGWFGSVVFSDYFSSILGLLRQGSSWSLNPFGEIRNEDHTLFERGRGNVCSVEFNCLYRWHATTSAQDEKWVEGVFTNLFEGKPADDITVKDFYVVAKKIKESEPDIQHWTFGGMSRQENGFFKDEDLANTLHNATEHAAGSFGARHTPHIMRLHEIMGIEANRKWGVCNLNDFRKFLGLKPYATFLEWNSNPEIADAAEKLYGDIQNLELYVGLQAEETKPVMEGAGLCPGYTVSRAILSDAIALTRGDRFFTQDYTPFNMTAWGYNDCQRDPNGAGFGSMLGRLFLRTLPEHFTENSVYTCMLGRLFLRTLPEHFTENSVYTWFPLMTPAAMKVNLEALGQLDKYNLSRPGTGASVTTVQDHSQVAQILADKTTFKTVYQGKASKFIIGKGFFLGSEDSDNERDFIVKALSTPESLAAIEKFFAENTLDLIKTASFSPVANKQTYLVDIIRDVFKYVPIRWAATEIAGIPLKTKANPGGAYTESELFDILAGIYGYIFLESDPGKQMVLGETVKKDTETLLGHIKAHLTGQTGILGALTSVLHKKTEHSELLKRLTGLGLSNDQLANSILALMVGATVETTIILTNALDVLLGYEKEAEIRSLFTNPAKNAAQIQGFVYETIRLEPPFKGVFRTADKNTTISSLVIQKGDRLFLDLANANKEETVFPNASSIDNTRAPKERYLIAEGTFSTLGSELATKIIASVLGTVVTLPNLRRGPGQSGQLHRWVDTADPIIRYAYLDKAKLQAPWPTSLIVQTKVEAFFDDESPSDQQRRYVHANLSPKPPLANEPLQSPNVSKELVRCAGFIDPPKKTIRDIQASECQELRLSDVEPKVALSVPELPSGFESYSWYRERTLRERLAFTSFPIVDVDEELVNTKRRRHDLETKYWGHHQWSLQFSQRPIGTGFQSAPRFNSSPDHAALWNDLEMKLFDKDGGTTKLDGYWHQELSVSIHNHEEKESTARSFTRAEAGALRMLNTRLHKVLLYTATDVAFRGWTHEIPILVHSCVKELSSRGIYSPSLFREFPTRNYHQLLDAFNEGPSFGENVDTHLIPVQDLSTLLATFIIRLKDGLLPRFFIEPLHHWCVIHSFEREEEARTEEQMRTTAARRYRLRYDDKLTIISLEEWDKDLKNAPLNWLNTEAKALHDEMEDKEILVAAALLRFMPAANLSLLDYLMTFFHKLISANYNNITDADIVRIGGPVWPI
ncbi:hypothetical protein HWV62_27534 [Athelia sp. TMB]|nr:hypothetical protein HWV62_27534 [Athelia sp. TMB]